MEEDTLDNWSKGEKHQLLHDLKTLNNDDLEKVCENLPNKSKGEIADIIENYKIQLTGHRNFRKLKKEKNRNSNNFIPLADWAKILIDKLSFEDLHTDISTALRLIAEFEEFPSPYSLNNVDFKAIYHSLANALEGKTLQCDKYVTEILEKCLLDTALTSKAIVRQPARKNGIKSLNVSDKPVNSFPRLTDNQELAHIRHLFAQRTYNPLNVSEEDSKLNRYE